jgi:putative MATE family efflux protein
MFRKLITLALPIMAGNFLQMLYNAVDTWFLGKLGAAEVSAPSIAMNIVMFLIVFGFGFAMAGTTLISQAWGKGDKERVDFYLGQITTILMLVSVMIAITGVVLTVPLLKLLQVPEEPFGHTRIYLQIIFSGMPFMFMAFALQATLQGIGNTMTPLAVQGITVLINVVLDPLLIFGVGPFPALGVAGAAWATVISRAMGSGVAIWILLSGRYGMKLRRENLKLERASVKLILRIGVPVSLGQGISGLGFVVMQGIVNSFGTAVIAAFGVAGRIIGMFNMPAMGLGRATAVLVGQHLGAREPEKAKEAVKTAVVVILVFICTGMAFTFFWGNSFVRFFIDDPEVISHGHALFRIVSVSVVFFALFTVITGAFQGGGDTRPVMSLNFARLWILRLPVAYLGAFLFPGRPEVIWWAMFISNVGVAAAGFLLLRRGKWLTALDPGEV